jgi:hypothetical protein
MKKIMAGYLIDISVAFKTIFWKLKKMLEQKKFVFVYFRIIKGNGTLGEPGTASW